MGSSQSVLPCIPRKVSLSIHQNQIVHSPESSTASSPIKSRESPSKFEISHPYPLVPGYRHSPIPHPHRSTTSSPASASGSPYKPALRNTQGAAGLARSPLGPRRVSSLPQTSLTGRSVAVGSDRIDHITSMDDTVIRTHISSSSSNVPAVQEAGSESWMERPRSLSTSPTPYSPPTSFCSLVSHIPSNTSHFHDRPHNSRRHKEEKRRSMVFKQQPGSGVVERGGKKLRKVLNVEGDWEIVRESDVRGTAINGRPDDNDGIDEEGGLEMARRGVEGEG